MTGASGTVVGEQRYYPFGETRWSTGSMYTDKLYTGQREMEGLGIYHYKARFYSPSLGRFLSPDTIIPGAANPQSWNRYSYVVNNPINASDPSGHKCVGELDECKYENGKQFNINRANKRTVKLKLRARDLLDYGYSVEELLALILQREAFPAWRDDTNLVWFSGEAEDPAEIFKEAATRWFWSWIKDSDVIKQYGQVRTNADLNAMIVNWLVSAMQSEDNVNKEILDGYSLNLKPEFLEIAQDVLHPTNKEWTKGDGMWSWGNAYLYEQAGVNYMSEHNRYSFGSGPTAWFTVDAETLRVIAPYKKEW